MQDATYPSLKDKVVVITGGGSGIGEAIVRRFAGQGSKVGFIDIKAEESKALATELSSSTAVHFEECDLTDVEALRAALKSIRAALGPIDILINNAAHDERHDIDSVTPEYWDNRMAVNLRHQFFAAQAVYKDMKETGGGAIVNLGSVSWMIGQGGMPGYTTAKSAIQGLTRSLARDLGPYNIRVNTLVPGWIMTQRQLDLWLTPEAEADLMERQCLKRKLYPDDIAKVALFLASDQAGGCTNQTFIVDGGWV
jgi:NAD(P)-dependent dehydrogenase (short-subunit alcohol dehydrogenase family)